MRSILDYMKVTPKPPKEVTITPGQEVTPQPLQEVQVDYSTPIGPIEST